MHHAVTALVDSALAFSAEVSPTPEPVDPELVTPGPWGFAVIALLAVAVIFLIWDMLRRIRRGRVRADIDEELDAEAAASDQAEAATRATETDDEDIDPADDPTRR